MSHSLSDLPTPAIVLDLDKLEANIAGMAAKCRQLGVALRPHIKTHKSIEIGRLQAEAGARGVTVATLYEAQRFAEAGFDDITWAFPIPLSRIAAAVALANKVSLGLVVDSVEAVAALEATGVPLRTLLKVDCGYHRAGVDPQAPHALEIAERIEDSRNLDFAGILTHSGHAYKARGQDALARVAEEERSVMAAFATSLKESGIECATVSVGSTPAMSAVQNLEGVTEARPGNYVFYDAMQVEIGSCSVSDCALTVLSSVVSASTEHAILDAGALALSKDAGNSKAERPSFGCGFADYEAGILDPDLDVFSLSQEHGWLRGSHPVGTRVRLLPQHSCLTAAQFDEYLVVRGDQVLDRWPILRGRD